MTRLWIFLSILLTLGAHSAAQSQQSAADLLHSALAAMGGEERIRNLGGVHVESSVVRNELEESERPEGPYILETDQVEE